MKPITILFVLQLLISYSLSAQNYVSNVEFTQDGDDIIITFDLKSLKNRQYYFIDIETNLEGTKKKPNPQNLSGDIRRVETGGQKTIKWNNAVQEIQFLDGILEIAIIAKLYEVPDNPSTEEIGFTTKKQMPHYIIWGASAASIGIGFALRGQSQDIYNNQYLTQTSEAAAEPFYQDANQKHHQYILMTRIGGGILIANTAWYLIRRNNINKAAGITSNFKLVPSSSGTVGLGFSYQF